MRTLLPAIGLLAACASGAEPPAGIRVRDSAGISIVENTRPLAPDSIAFRVDSVPVLEIGGSSDSHGEFGRVAGVARLRGGTIVVADGNNNELRLFDSTGAWLRSVGHKGGGPGEFQQLGILFRLGPDSLGTFDFNLRRVSVFGADGRLGRELTFPQGLDAGFPIVIGVLGNDLLVQTQMFSQSQQSGPQRDTVPVFRYPRWLPPVVPLGRFPGSEIYKSVQRNSAGLISSTMTTMMPFGKAPTMATAAGRLQVGTGDRQEIAAYDTAGTLVRLTRWTGLPQPVTDADIAAIKRERLEGFGPGAEVMRDRVRGILEDMTFPSTKPAYEGFVAAVDGRLWVRQYDQPAPSRPVRYDVFDPQGQWLGHVTFPPRFALHEAGPDYVLGVWSDADDVERVRLYHLNPSPQ